MYRQDLVSALREKFTTQFSLTTKLILTVTLTLTDKVKLISQTKLRGELLSERLWCLSVYVTWLRDP